MPGVRTPLGTTQSNLLPSWSLHSSEGGQETNLQKILSVPGGDTCHLETFKLKRGTGRPGGGGLPPLLTLYIHLAYTTGLLQRPEQQTPWFAVATPSVLCLLVWWSGDLFTAVTSAWRVLSKPGKRLLHLILWCGSMFLVQGAAARPVVWVKGVWGDGVGEETAGSAKTLWVRVRPVAFPLCELGSHGQAWSRGVIGCDWCSNRYLCARPWEGTVASLKRPLKDSRSQMVAWTCVRTEEVVTCAEEGYPFSCWRMLRLLLYLDYCKWCYNT